MASSALDSIEEAATSAISADVDFPLAAASAAEDARPWQSWTLPRPQPRPRPHPDGYDRNDVHGYADRQATKVAANTMTVATALAKSVATAQAMRTTRSTTNHGHHHGVEHGHDHGHMKTARRLRPTAATKLRPQEAARGSPGQPRLPRSRRQPLPCPSFAATAPSGHEREPPKTVTSASPFLRPRCDFMAMTLAHGHKVEGGDGARHDTHHAIGRRGTTPWPSPSFTRDPDPR